MADLPSELHQQAISAALASNWETALQINEQIIEVDPKNIDALNRLARANFELGNIQKAKEYYELALQFDPYNQIAFKFLKRIEAFSKKSATEKELLISSQNNIPLGSLSDLFIEEPGITKQIALLKVAEPQKLSLLSPGEMVTLVLKNRGIAVTTGSGEYLGVLPDDLSHHLIRLIKGGNKYQALIKTAKPNGLSIMIRETYRCARFKNQPSFLDSVNNNFTYSSDHIVMADDRGEEVTSDTGDEEEMA